MKFKMIHLGYRSTPDYPWDYRIELLEYFFHERENLHEWLHRSNIDHISAGPTKSVIYLRKKDATLFALRWGQ